MKIWITSFVWDDDEYEGPNILAETLEKAQYLANLQGLTLEGHLIDNLDSVEDFELLERTEGTMLH